jgi:hypothetical protein
MGKGGGGGAGGLAGWLAGWLADMCKARVPPKKIYLRLAKQCLNCGLKWHKLYIIKIILILKANYKSLSNLLLALVYLTGPAISDDFVTPPPKPKKKKKKRLFEAKFSGGWKWGSGGKAPY